MIVYHGTAGTNFDSIQARGLRASVHGHVPKDCACTTTVFKVAAMFALRKTSSADWGKGPTITGIVLEFDLGGVEGKDWLPVRDPHCMQDEAEIAVFRPNRLRLVARWVYSSEWVRHPLERTGGT